MEKVERCIKEEVEICVQDKLQHCLFEGLKNHFKLMEDNVVKRISEQEKPGVSDSSMAGGKEKW